MPDTLTRLTEWASWPRGMEMPPPSLYHQLGAPEPPTPTGAPPSPSRAPCGMHPDSHPTLRWHHMACVCRYQKGLSSPQRNLSTLEKNHELLKQGLLCHPAGEEKMCYYPCGFMSVLKTFPRGPPTSTGSRPRAGAGTQYSPRTPTYL